MFLALKFHFILLGLKMPQKSTSGSANSLQSQRIDKWLWAARFFKTRALAVEAIKKGRVLLDGQKIKPGKEIKPGAMLGIKQSYFTKTIKVLALSQRRGPATIAANLYEETSESITNRERLKEIQVSQPALRRSGLGRPTKRERRQIISFTSKGKS